MAGRKNSDKMGQFYRMKFQGAAMLVRWWKGPPVIVFVPSSEPVRIRKGRGPIPLVCKVPVGAMRGIRLTPERKQFLLRQGMDPELIKKGWVWDVSDALASQFEKERKATEALAVKCGLTPNDFGKILEAKRKLASFQPSNRMERMAKRGLEYLFSSKPPKKEAGRPSRISAAERQQLRQRAEEMKAAGRSRDDIVAQFCEEYGLGLSYVRRILEDRPIEKEQ